MSLHHAHDGARAARDMRPLAGVFVLMTGYTAVEVVGGLLTGSLALLADAGHMLADDLALGLALFAAWLAGRPATPQRSFGLRRAEILAALANGVLLIAVAMVILIEAGRRLDDPPDVLAGWVLVVAAIGLGVNALGAWLLSRAGSDNLNMRAALRHVLADLAGSVGVIAAALVILATGWRYADPLASIVIGALILAASWSVLRDSVGVLLESTPRGIDAGALGRRLSELPGVDEIHDLHIWTITSGFPALSAHVLVRPGEDCHARRRQLERVLADEFGIEHTTLQVDHRAEQNGLVQIGATAPRGS